VFKIYLSTCLSILFIGVHAQQIEKHNLILKNTLVNSAPFKTNNHNSINSLTCDTVTTITVKDTLTLYSIVSTSVVTNGGYVTGNNGYGDSAIATFIPHTLIPSDAQISGVIVVFYRYGSLGTKGTQAITLNVFAGDTIHGPTTNTIITGTNTVITTAPPIGTATASLATISAITPTNNAIPHAVAPTLSSNYEIPYMFSFASPITVPDTGFFISLTLPTNTGDTVVLLCTRNDSSKTNYAWDFGVHGWRAYSNSNDWNLHASLTLFPVICYQPVAINEFNIQNEEFRVYPNPAKNILNIEGLIANERTDIVITDILGNTLKQFKIQNSKFRTNVADLNAGVYFIMIADNKNNRISKKLIIE